jgi:hypothetical protein
MEQGQFVIHLEDANETLLRFFIHLKASMHRNLDTGETELTFEKERIFQVR